MDYAVRSSENIHSQHFYHGETRNGPKQVIICRAFREHDLATVAKLSAKHGDVEDLEFWGRVMVTTTNEGTQIPLFDNEELARTNLCGEPLFIEHSYPDGIKIPAPHQMNKNLYRKPGPNSVPLGKVLVSDGTVQPGELWIKGKIDTSGITPEQIEMLRSALRDGTLGSLSAGYAHSKDKKAIDAEVFYHGGGIPGIGSDGTYIKHLEVSLCRIPDISGSDIVFVKASKEGSEEGIDLTTMDTSSSEPTPMESTSMNQAKAIDMVALPQIPRQDNQKSTMDVQMPDVSEEKKHEQLPVATPTQVVAEQVVIEQPHQQVVAEQPRQQVVTEQPRQQVVAEQPRQPQVQRQQVVAEQPRQPQVQRQQVVAEQPRLSEQIVAEPKQDTTENKSNRADVTMTDTPVKQNYVSIDDFIALKSQLEQLQRTAQEEAAHRQAIIQAQENEKFASDKIMKAWPVMSKEDALNMVNSGDRKTLEMMVNKQLELQQKMQPVITQQQQQPAKPPQMTQLFAPKQPVNEQPTPVKQQQPRDFHGRWIPMHGGDITIGGATGALAPVHMPSNETHRLRQDEITRRLEETKDDPQHYASIWNDPAMAFERHRIMSADPQSVTINETYPGAANH